MLAQYVYPSKSGLFRIIRHGRQWRVLCEDSEIGRHETAEAALIAIRMVCPQARLPGALAEWRYIPELALAHSRVSSDGTAGAWLAEAFSRPLAELHCSQRHSRESGSDAERWVVTKISGTGS